MNNIETIEDFRHFVMEHDLPFTEMALFGIKCPYCGKSDQIRKLESPEDLINLIEQEALAAYSAFFQKIQKSEPSVGVCRFCRNCLNLTEGGGAMPLVEGFD